MRSRVELPTVASAGAIEAKPFFLGVEIQLAQDLIELPPIDLDEAEALRVQSLTNFIQALRRIFQYHGFDLFVERQETFIYPGLGKRVASLGTRTI